MKGDLMVILDNSMYSINKDYTKERLDCQIEVTKCIVDKRLAESTESTVGVMSLGRSTTIKIVSPTSDKNTICSYLYSLQRDNDIQPGNSLSIARMALKYRTNQSQAILLFLGSPLDDTSLTDIVVAIENILNNNVAVRVVLFGEAIEYYTLLKSSIEECSDFTCVTITPQDSFLDGVATALRESVQETDPELELAIRRSLQDAEDPEVQKAIKESLQDG
ncbi:26S proteasome regulatory subunit N10 [Nematocida homosporus]|uniref:26S proteasome regulatory subunit N10 n=1 Tax=Nematocida homosporus TaxID=1912981 RepID=UPI00221E854E|nr:26S proteasome regulatory subunit N10 [Nematocida homosporus]KAI5186368.1 26S proteasome regulatory subunit N10 [Nematocida homosporus]